MELKYKASCDLIYLVKCALNDTVPDPDMISAMDLSEVYKVAKHHFLTSVSFEVLKSYEFEDTLKKEWQNDRNKSIRKNMMLDAGRIQITEFMENNGIWYMPLKGIILKDLYSAPGMRQMSDNDILFDEKYRKEIHDFFIKNCYKCQDYGKYNHDVYMKKPVYNYEMHTALFHISHEEKFHKYYENTKQMLIKDEDNKFGYHFSDEDFYVYITAHEYKHYSTSGTGLRTFADTYVYLKHKNLNRKYLDEQFQKLGISSFEKQLSSIAMNLFSPDGSIKTLSKSQLKMLDYCIFSGTYGTIENFSKINYEKFRNSGKSGKFSYWMGRIFPGPEFMRAYFPFFYRHKWLIPVCWVYRAVRGIFKKRKLVLKEFNTIKSLK